VLDLVRKRHDGPAWVVVEELGNSTGGNVSRHADAVAIGLWPSRGYEIHGYELKASRGDVQKELNDPSKADAVGKFCDYWWLVVEDLKIIDGLVIPDAWGILYPKNKVLRVHRKAPKRVDVTPVHRGFVAAIVRRVCEGWVPKHVHEELKKNGLELAKAELLRERKWEIENNAHELKALRTSLQRFEEWTGVSISQRYGGDGDLHALNDWELQRIGDAVKVVRQAREAIGRHAWQSDNAEALVRAELDGIERSIRNHEHSIASRRAAADQLRMLLESLSEDQKASA
jgi:hypothetical protein